MKVPRRSRVSAAGRNAAACDPDSLAREIFVVPHTYVALSAPLLSGGDSERFTGCRETSLRQVLAQSGMNYGSHYRRCFVPLRGDIQRRFDIIGERDRDPFH